MSETNRIIRAVAQRHHTLDVAPGFDLSFLQLRIGQLLHISIVLEMNFYFEAANILNKLDNKQGSIKGVLSSVPEKDRKRMSALVIESLKCTSVLVSSWFVAPG